MMVLRHVGPPSSTEVSHEDIGPREDRPASPIDLSNKNVRSTSVSEVSRHLAKSPFLSIVPAIRPLSRNHTHNNHNNNNIYISNNNNNNNNSSVPVPRTSSEDAPGKLCRSGSDSGSASGLTREVRWRDMKMIQVGNDEDNSYSSPDSGLHRDSPGEGEDEEVSPNKSSSPPLSLSRKQTQSLIPLSLIRARYNHNHHTPRDKRGDGTSTPSNNPEDSTKSDAPPPDQVKSKRARLEEMVTNIKTSKDRTRRNSGDDDSSGGHVTSSDEVTDDCPTDLRSSAFRNESSILGANKRDAINLNISRDVFRVHDEEDMDEEPCNLVCPKSRGASLSDTQNFDAWKNKVPQKAMPPLSPSDAAKMYGVDPETYQQQMMQLQLTSAAMLGDPGGLLKAMGGYPPLVYLGYYSQLLHSFQAQEILRQYAMQSQNVTPTVSQGEKSPSVPRTLGSSGYNCRSPLSPASLSEGPTGMDSDGSVVGQTTPGSANGKRAPRAMTGRHVRTGTGASPSTLQTLRQKIEERQRIKAQQVRNDVVMQSNSKGKSVKYSKKSKK